MGVILALLAVLFSPAGAGATTASSTTTRVSVASDGAQGNGNSVPNDISGSGRFVAFESNASNLVPGDTNGVQDVFVHDRGTGTASRVSVASDGAEGNGASRSAAISRDGRYVTFSSFANNLVANDTNNIPDVFVHDRLTGATTRVSVASDGTQATGVNSNSSSESPDVSDDGRYVAFSSTAVNLVVPDATSGHDLYVHDRQTGATTRVSVSSEGVQGAGGSGFSFPSISGDGTLVAFASGAANLVVGDTNNSEDVFIHDRATRTTSRVTAPVTGPASNPDISGDGSTVAFQIATSTSVGFPRSSIYAYHRPTNTFSLVSVASDGSSAGQVSGAAAAGQVSGAATNADGRYVAFVTSAVVVEGDTNGREDVFVRDLTSEVTRRVSVASDGTQANNSSSAPALDASGLQVAFSSRATNLVPGDTNGADDVFVHAPNGPVVSVGDVAVHEGDSGTPAAVFTVSLTKPSATTVTVAYATANGTAIGTDFTAKAGTLSFAPGVTSATVKVPVIGDNADEGDQSFTLGLSSPTGAFIADATGVGTIYDDDPATGRRLAVGDVAVHEGDAGGRAAVFTVSLSKAATSYVKVNFATAKGTALGADFTTKSGTLSFAPGTTSMTVKVPITPDTIDEADEAFSLNLSGASGATIADATGTGTILDND